MDLSLYGLIGRMPVKEEAAGFRMERCGLMGSDECRMERCGLAGMCERKENRNK